MLHKSLEFVENVAFERVRKALQSNTFDKTYPKFLNEEVPIFAHKITKKLYAQLNDWFDDDEFVEMPKSY